MFGLNTISPVECCYTLRNWVYGIKSAKYFWAFVASLIYISLLIWFAHIDVIIECYKVNAQTYCEITDKIVYKYAHILSLLTNLGLLSMLFIDLLMAHKYDQAISLTLLNLIGVFAMIGIFWLAVGCDPKIVNSIGGLGNKNGSLIFLMIFVFTLLLLKFIAIKPTDE